MKAARIDQLIGNTPLVPLKRLTKAGEAEVWVKLESFNPAGSVKDRPALFMIRAAEKEGILKKGGTIIEATSGNTGIALAMLAAAGGYRAIFVMPDTLSIERRQLLSAYGAEVLLTEGEKGMAGALDAAEDLVARRGYFLPQQFTNINNVRAHYETTGVEILRDLGGSVDAFVAGVGTGGTITGVGRRLKEKNKNTEIIAVEPQKSPILSGGDPGPHGIQGIGPNFVPQILDRSILDEIIPVEDEAAYETARALAVKEGIFCGISAGANVYAALKIARRLGAGKRVVTILPDTGERYLSTVLFTGEGNNA
ncbi:MAG: cysteine synthase A [Firmicutes bacterium]|nr:cysteine synthase A [Bacillota bacterium]